MATAGSYNTSRAAKQHISWQQLGVTILHLQLNNTSRGNNWELKYLTCSWTTHLVATAGSYNTSRVAEQHISCQQLGVTILHVQLNNICRGNSWELQYLTCSWTTHAVVTAGNKWHWHSLCHKNFHAETATST